VKLKSAVLLNALKAAYEAVGTTPTTKASFEALSTTATFSKTGFASFSAVQGYFLLLSQNFESVESFDETVLSLFRSLTDSTELSEAARISFYKAFADNGYVTDTQVFEYVKRLGETVGVSEVFEKTANFNRHFLDTPETIDIISKQLSRPFGDGLASTDILRFSPFLKALNEAPSAVDAIDAFAITKFLADQTTATDDLDGEATTEDDQEMQFAKVRVNIAAATDDLNLAMAYNRAFADSYGVADSDVLNFGKRLADTTSMTDVGSLRSQGFADFTYFAEDFVGASRTFT